MTTEKIKERLVLAAVKNLKEFGFPDLNTENIFTDPVYSKFFSSMLDGSKGISDITDEAISQLKQQLKQTV